MPACTHTGKEPSPKGLGFCAHNKDEGYTHKGTDGNRWIVGVDKNGRHFWKRLHSSEPKRVRDSAPKRTRSSSPKRHCSSYTRVCYAPPYSMSGAADIVRNLRKYDHEEFDREFNSAMPQRNKLYYYPDKKLRVRAAVPGRPRSSRGYLVGQGAISNFLGVVADDYSGGDWEVVKGARAKEYLYPYEGFLVTGSGADPAFEIVS